jgi:GDPmannose 4,6-dehydratase
MQNPLLVRPADVDLLVGDPTKANTKLGWQAKTTFSELVAIMVDAECRIAADRKN